MVYRGIYPPDAPTALINSLPWWLPEYPGSPTAPPKVALWDGKAVPTDWSKSGPLMWQFTGAGKLAGVKTQIDLSRIVCPPQVIKDYFTTGKLTAWAA